MFDVKWSDYDELCKILTEQVRKNEINFNSILAVSRGGLPVGTYLSHHLELPLFIISAKFYDDFDNTTLHIDENISGIGKIKSPVLVVDEINDTGATISGVQSYLYGSNGIIHSQKDRTLETSTAVLIERKHSKSRADFVAFRTKRAGWFHFPYESYPAKGHYSVWGFPWP